MFLTNLLNDILDFGIDGVLTAKRINQISKDVWVVATSAFISVEEKERCKQVGIQEFLRKPVEQSELIDMLCRYSKRSRS
nr:response regulator [uncultured Sphaerochaeta sp.]